MAYEQTAVDAVLAKSGALPVEPVPVVGYDFNGGVDYQKLLSSFRTTGFQATSFGRAVQEINRMVSVQSNVYVIFKKNRR